MISQHNPQHCNKNEKPQVVNSDNSEYDEEEFNNDINELSPIQFIAKYTKARQESMSNTISTDVMCYIVMSYLDWKTVFSSCLLVCKEFFRRIANNRQLFINLFNELFVMKQEEIENVKFSDCKHKRTFKVDYESQYPGFAIPNEHYHFCSDYGYSFPSEKECEDLKHYIRKFHVSSRIMTDAKLKLIREKWMNATAVYKKSKNLNPVTRKEENQSLLNLIKRIIKDRLFIRKFFNKDLKSERFGEYYPNDGHIYWEMRYQTELKNQIENLINGKSNFGISEIEGIEIGHLNCHNQTDVFMDCFQNYSYFHAHFYNLVSFVANDTDKRLISHFSTCDIKPIFNTFPNLKAFVSRGKFLSISPVKSFHLSVLILKTGGMDAAMLTGILNCDFPQLKHLELWFGSYGYGNSVSVSNLEELLSVEENGKYPLLEYFGIRNSERLEQFLTPLVESNLLKRLRILDISLCGKQNGPTLLEFAQMLERKTRNSFPLLELIDMHGNYVTEDAKYEMHKIFHRIGIIVDISVSYKWNVARQD